MQVTSLLAALENYYASDIIISSTGKLLQVTTLLAAQENCK